MDFLEKGVQHFYWKGPTLTSWPGIGVVEVERCGLILPKWPPGSPLGWSVLNVMAFLREEKLRYFIGA